MKVRNGTDRGRENGKKIRRPSPRRPPSEEMEPMVEGPSRLDTRKASNMLSSGIAEERMKAREILLNVVLEVGSEIAREMLLEDCRKALESEGGVERKHTRRVLAQLTLGTSCKKARQLLEEGFNKALRDLDLPALVFLGVNGRPDIAKAADKALEENFDKIAGKICLDALSYIAAMSGCSLKIRRKAAVIVADSEKRAGNLIYIRDASDDYEIRNMMDAALERRRGLQGVDEEDIDTETHRIIDAEIKKQQDHDAKHK